MSAVFAGVKPGDAVAVFEFRRIRKQTVKRVTATQLETEDGCKFMRRTGTKVGSGDYYRARAEPWAAEHDRRLKDEREEALHARRRNELADIRWGHLSREEVLAAHRALTAAGLLKKEKPEVQP